MAASSKHSFCYRGAGFTCFCYCGQPCVKLRRRLESSQLNASTQHSRHVTEPRCHAPSDLDIDALHLHHMPTRCLPTTPAQPSQSSHEEREAGGAASLRRAPSVGQQGWVEASLSLAAQERFTTKRPKIIRCCAALVPKAPGILRLLKQGIRQASSQRRRSPGSYDLPVLSILSFAFFQLNSLS